MEYVMAFLAVVSPLFAAWGASKVTVAKIGVELKHIGKDVEDHESRIRDLEKAPNV